MTIAADGHRPVDNWAQGTPPSPAPEAFRTTRPKIVSQQEAVPGYKSLQRTRPARRPRIIVGESAETPRPVSAAAASFGTREHLEVVIDQDDRTAVPDPTEFPWRHICSLHIESQGGRHYVGTGWFIGPSTLMTAGHCVYLHDDGGWPKSVVVTPALNGTVQPYGQAIATRFHSTEGWTQRRDTNCDYGALQLNDPDAHFGDLPGWFAFGALDDANLKTNLANIAGYPADLDRASRLYFHSRLVTSVSASKLFYDIDTYGGQSGSPIFFTIGDERVAVGVHTTGSSTSNSGTRITDEVAQNMRLWRTATSAPTLKAVGGTANG